jgi:hypothetical protein
MASCRRRIERTVRVTNRNTPRERNVRLMAEEALIHRFLGVATRDPERRLSTC